MTKKRTTKETVSQSADGKTWVMPEAKPKAEKKGEENHRENAGREDQ